MKGYRDECVSWGQRFCFRLPILLPAIDEIFPFLFIFSWGPSFSNAMYR